MEWLSLQDTSHDLLAVLHPPYSLILWNADTGTRIWKKTYTEQLISFSFDPFNAANLACKLLFAEKNKLKYICRYILNASNI